MKITIDLNELKLKLADHPLGLQLVEAEVKSEVQAILQKHKKAAVAEISKLAVDLVVTFRREYDSAISKIVLETKE